MLTREQILQVVDRQFEDVEVPEWGGTVRIGTMSGAERDEWEQSLVSGNSKKVDVSNIRARLFAACAVNMDGTRMFTSADAELLGMKSFQALDRCVKVAQRLNGLSDGDVEAAKGN